MKTEAGPEQHEEGHVEKSVARAEVAPMQWVMASALERAVLIKMRDLAAVVQRGVVVPPELLKHGTSSIAEVAMFLGITPDAVRALAKAGALVCSTKGRIPNSETLRRLQQQHVERISELSFEAKNLVRYESPLIAGDDDSEFEPPRRGGHWRPGCCGYSPAGAAKELGLSEAAVRRLITDGKLFAWGRHGAGFLITKEELTAFKKKLAALEMPEVVA